MDRLDCELCGDHLHLTVWFLRFSIIPRLYIVHYGRWKPSYIEINCHTINQFMFESSSLVDRVVDSLCRSRRCQDSACFQFVPETAASE